MCVCVFQVWIKHKGNWISPILRRVFPREVWLSSKGLHPNWNRSKKFPKNYTTYTHAHGSMYKYIYFAHKFVANKLGCWKVLWTEASVCWLMPQHLRGLYAFQNMYTSIKCKVYSYHLHIYKDCIRLRGLHWPYRYQSIPLSLIPYTYAPYSHNCCGFHQPCDTGSQSRSFQLTNHKLPYKSDDHYLQLRLVNWNFCSDFRCML